MDSWTCYVSDRSYVIVYVGRVSYHMFHNRVAHATDRFNPSRLRHHSGANKKKTCRSCGLSYALLSCSNTPLALCLTLSPTTVHTRSPPTASAYTTPCSSSSTVTPLPSSPQTQKRSPPPTEPAYTFETATRTDLVQLLLDDLAALVSGTESPTRLTRSGACPQLRSPPAAGG